MTRKEAIEYGKEQLDIFSEGCQHYEFIKMALSALEKENIYDDKELYVTISKALYDKLNVDACDDAISREDVDAQISEWVVLREYVDEEDRFTVKKLHKRIAKLPPVQPTRKGHWIQIDYQRGKFECSECHTQGYVDTCMYEPIWEYCPRCGARMKVKDVQSNGTHQVYQGISPTLNTEQIKPINKDVAIGWQYE